MSKAGLSAVLFILVGTACLGWTLTSGDKTLFQPGETTDGHYLFEQQCHICHGEAFDGDTAIEESCLHCHRQEWRLIAQSIPK